MKSYLDTSIIKDYEDAISEVAAHFIRKYFGKDSEWYWIADCIGDVFYVNDRFFSIDDMVNFLKYGYTANQMFKYYDYRLEIQTKNLEEDKYNPIINIKNFIKLK